MEELTYYDLETFINMFSTGKLSMNQPVEVTNINRDKRIHMSFLKHGIHLSKKYDTNLLDILSKIKYKIKEDLLVLLDSNSYVRNYVQKIIEEWGIDDLSATDLLLDGFDEQSEYTIDPSVFEYQRVVDEHTKSDDLENKLKAIEDTLADKPINQTGGFSIKNIDESVQSIHTECKGCTSRIESNLQELEKKNDLINPLNSDIIMDLTMKHKPQYLEQSHIDNESSMIPTFMTARNSNEIPDMIHIIFLNYLLTTNMIHKEVDYLISSFQRLLDDMNDKHKLVSEYLQRLTPGTHMESTQEVSYFDRFKQLIPSFDSSDEDESSFDTGNNEIDSLVNRVRNNKRNKNKTIDDEHESNLGDIVVNPGIHSFY